jgi:hypothetical protein
MDRPDEARNVEDTDEVRSGSGEDDVLGSGGAAAPKTSGDPGASRDPETARRRRGRAMEDEDESRLE